jgi:hypothetical protein
MSTYRHTKLSLIGMLIPFTREKQRADKADQCRETCQEERYNHGPSSTGMDIDQGWWVVFHVRAGTRSM